MLFRSDVSELRRLALMRWGVLYQHIAFVSRLAAEVRDIADGEHAITAARFGVAPVPGRTDPNFIPFGGAQTLSDLPTVAAAFMSAIESVYRPIPPPSPPVAAPVAGPSRLPLPPLLLTAAPDVEMGESAHVGNAGAPGDPSATTAAGPSS